MNNLSRIEPSGKRGLVHLYCGDGKGKTSAAVGLCARAVTHGRQILFCQFMKDGKSGEVKSLEAIGAETLFTNESGKFLSQMSGDDIALFSIIQQEKLQIVNAKTQTGKYDVVVLDEIVDLLDDIIPMEDILAFLENRPDHVEIVITGHEAPEALCAVADYHTEFSCRRHPFQSGIKARPGIEY